MSELGSGGADDARSPAVSGRFAHSDCTMLLARRKPQDACGAGVAGRLGLKAGVAGDAPIAIGLAGE